MSVGIFKIVKITKILPQKIATLVSLARNDNIKQLTKRKNKNLQFSQNVNQSIAGVCSTKPSPFVAPRHFPRTAGESSYIVP